MVLPQGKLQDKHRPAGGGVLHPEIASVLGGDLCGNAESQAKAAPVFRLVHMAFQPFQKSKVIHIAGSDTQNGCNQVFIFIGYHNIVDVQKY